MTRKLAYVSLLLINAALISTLSLQSSQAAIDFPTKWGDNATEPYFIDTGVPSGFRSAMATGINNMSDKAGGHGPRFVWDGLSSESWNASNPCQSASTVFVVPDLGPYGRTTRCIETFGTVGERITGFNIAINTSTQLSWYAGSGAPGPTQWDIRSIVTHEAGHATGMLGHFDESAPHCPDPRNANTATMCEGNDSIIGTIWLRTPEPADLNRLEQAY